MKTNEYITNEYESTFSTSIIEPYSLELPSISSNLAEIATGADYTHIFAENLASATVCSDLQPLTGYTEPKLDKKDIKPIKIGVFIPGRLSSERLPNKLILPLNDDKDTLWSIACSKVDLLPEKYVRVALCSDRALREISRSFYNLETVERDQDTAKAEGPMSYIFKDLKVAHPEVTHWMFLNPCLSLLKGSTIKECLEKFEKNPTTFGTSVKKYQNWLWNIDKENLTPVDYSRLTTKEIHNLYEAAHAFHIFESDFLYTEDKDTLMLNEKPSLFEINKEELIDVDTQQDYDYLVNYININDINLY